MRGFEGRKMRIIARLISATFMANSFMLPMASAANSVSLVVGDHSNDSQPIEDSMTYTTEDTTITAENTLADSNSETTDVRVNTSTSVQVGDSTVYVHPNDANQTKDFVPSWALHEDGTALTDDELQALNYKESYSDYDHGRICKC